MNLKWFRLPFVFLFSSCLLLGCADDKSSAAYNTTTPNNVDNSDNQSQDAPDIEDIYPSEIDDSEENIDDADNNLCETTSNLSTNSSDDHHCTNNEEKENGIIEEPSEGITEDNNNQNTPEPNDNDQNDNESNNEQDEDVQPLNLTKINVKFLDYELSNVEICLDHDFDGECDYGLPIFETDSEGRAYITVDKSMLQEMADKSSDGSIGIIGKAIKQKSSYITNVDRTERTERRTLPKSFTLYNIVSIDTLLNNESVDIDVYTSLAYIIAYNRYLEEKTGNVYERFIYAIEDIEFTMSHDQCDIFYHMDEDYYTCSKLAAAVMVKAGIIPEEGAVYQQKVDVDDLLRSLSKISLSSYYHLKNYNDDITVLVEKVYADVFDSIEPQPNQLLYFTVESSNLTQSFTMNLPSTISEESEVTFDWDFGDDSTSSLQNPVYTYSKPGIYNVSVNVSVDNQITNIKEKVYAVQDLSKLSKICAYSTINTPVFTVNSVAGYVVVTLSPWSISRCSQIYGLNYKQLDYEVDFGDGYKTKIEYGKSLSRYIADDGVYDITVTASANGLYPLSTTKTVTVAKVEQYKSSLEIFSRNTESNYPERMLSLLLKTNKVDKYSYSLWVIKDELGVVKDVLGTTYDYNHSQNPYELIPDYQTEKYYAELYNLYDDNEVSYGIFEYINPLYNKFEFQNPNFNCFTIYIGTEIERTRCQLTGAYFNNVKPNAITFSMDYGDGASSKEVTNYELDHKYARSGRYLVTAYLKFKESGKVFWKKSKYVEVSKSN